VKKTIHRANSRGQANLDWLKSFHSFSFADYHNRERMSFGLLRVLNDDLIAPNKGFDTHVHNNMEIISILVKGELRHKDSMGNEEVIRQNEVQIMSAGSGVEHSEYNNSKTEECNLLQLWVYPKEKNIAPRYEQKLFEYPKNKFQLVVSPDEADESLWINQEAHLSILDLEKDKESTYTLFQKTCGVYFFVISGKVSIENELLDQRDALGLEDIEKSPLKALEDARILCIEVPMLV
jgi:redox-sensitive bicupin YhaK (pirin superfamily)